VGFKAARVRNHSPEFVVVPVTVKAWNDKQRRHDLRKTFGCWFGGAEVILMCTDANGRQWFFGDRDLVDYLKARSTDTDHLPWAMYEVDDEGTSDGEGLAEKIFMNVFTDLATNFVARLLGIPPPPPGVG
jgi:hypothetical protein